MRQNHTASVSRDVEEGMCSAWTDKLAGSASQELRLLRPDLALGAQGLKRQNGLLPFRNLCDRERRYNQVCKGTDHGSH